MKKKIFINTYSDRRGDLSFVQNSKKFKFSRLYYIHNIKKKTIRGKHYHKNNRQFIICISGQIKLRIVNVKNNKESTLILNDPKVGTFIENYEWHTIGCDRNSIILVLAEKLFSKKDYFTI